MPVSIGDLLEERQGFDEALRTAMHDVALAAALIGNAFRKGGKLLICGNGGSAADAQHMAAEFVGRFERDRPGLPAISLSTDTSALTAIGNDWEFSYVFRRQLEALGRRNDVLLGISTSGKSSNVLEALAHARTMGVRTIGLVGRDGGDMAQHCDVLINVGGQRTPIIQERMLAVEHMVCELVEEGLRPVYSVDGPPRTYCFDIDGTICVSTDGFYDRARPYPKRIARVNELYDAGHRILMYTARGSVSGIDHRELTERQLKEWGVKYHELRLGKPQYDIIIDDKALNDVDYFGFKE